MDSQKGHMLTNVPIANACRPLVAAVCLLSFTGCAKGAAARKVEQAKPPAAPDAAAPATKPAPKALIATAADGTKIAYERSWERSSAAVAPRRWANSQRLERKRLRRSPQQALHRHHDGPARHRRQRQTDHARGLCDWIACSGISWPSPMPPALKNSTSGDTVTVPPSPDISRLDRIA